MQGSDCIIDDILKRLDKLEKNFYDVPQPGKIEPIQAQKPIKLPMTVHNIRARLERLDRERHRNSLKL